MSAMPEGLPIPFEVVTEMPLPPGKHWNYLRAAPSTRPNCVWCAAPWNCCKSTPAIPGCTLISTRIFLAPRRRRRGILTRGKLHARAVANLVDVRTR